MQISRLCISFGPFMQQIENEPKHSDLWPISTDENSLSGTQNKNTHLIAIFGNILASY